jgi:hypothetical protein
MATPSGHRKSIIKRDQRSSMQPPAVSERTVLLPVVTSILFYLSQFAKRLGREDKIFYLLAWKAGVGRHWIYVDGFREGLVNLLSLCAIKKTKTVSNHEDYIPKIIYFIKYFSYTVVAIHNL